MIAAYRLATEWKSNNPSTERNFRGNDGVSFLLDGEDSLCGTVDETHNTQGLLLKKNGNPVECFMCKKNHLKEDCLIWKARNLVQDKPPPSGDMQEQPISAQVEGDKFTTLSGVDVGSSNWEQDYDLGGNMLI